MLEGTLEEMTEMEEIEEMEEVEEMEELSGNSTVRYTHINT